MSKLKNTMRESKMLIGYMSDGEWYNSKQLQTVCGNPQARMAEIRKRSKWDFVKSKIDGSVHYRLAVKNVTVMM